MAQDQAYIDSSRNWMANQRLCIQTCQNLIDYRKKEIAILNEQLELDLRQLELEHLRLANTEKEVNDYIESTQ